VVQLLGQHSPRQRLRVPLQTTEAKGLIVPWTIVDKPTKEEAMKQKAAEMDTTHMAYSKWLKNEKEHTRSVLRCMRGR
jgi:hypothetical protein